MNANNEDLNKEEELKKEEVEEEVNNQNIDEPLGLQTQFLKASKDIIFLHS